MKILHFASIYDHLFLSEIDTFNVNNILIIIDLNHK